MSNQVIFFWRETESPYGFLSQWYHSPFEVDGVLYQSAEMWMMIQKALLFGDEEIAKQMMQTTSPKDHKELGRKARGFDSEKWDQHKLRIVEEGNYHKFTKCTNDPDMRAKLLDTGDRYLVEASPYDSIWGIGFDAANAGANRARWGENLLGIAIQNVRQRLRKEDVAGSVDVGENV